MEKFFQKKSTKRPKEWKLKESEEKEVEILSQNLKSSKGILLRNQSIQSSYKSNDIRSYEKIETQSIIQKASIPYFRSYRYSNWTEMDRKWLTQQYLHSVKPTGSLINTSFPLSFNNSNNTQEFRVVNTRTVDMCFSSSSSFLATACNCIKGGYISILKGSSLQQNDTIINSEYNPSISKSVQMYYKDPITSIQWYHQDQSILSTHRGSRTISLFDIHTIQSHSIATLPYFVDQVIPVTSTNCFLVSLADGKMKMIDIRESGRFTSNWTTDVVQRKSISCFHVTEQSPNEVVVAYKNPASIEILDIRNTRSSPISGTKSPILLSSQLLTLPKNAYILSTIPYFTEKEVVCTLSSGDIAIINTTTGSYRCYTEVDENLSYYQWDGIIPKPFHPQLLQESFYVPSIVHRTCSLPIFDFQSLESNTKYDVSPTRYSIECPEEVFGCCYSEQLKMMVISCGCNTLEHRLRVYSFL